MAAMSPKIQALLDTHQGQNTYIAVYLMIHQLGYRPEQALKDRIYAKIRVLKLHFWTGMCKLLAYIQGLLVNN